MQLALDEVLLSELAAGRLGPLLRLWEWAEPAIVLGSHQSVANEVDAGQAARRGFQILRRMSGGGAMIVEPGRTVTWSLYAPAESVAGLSFAASYGQLDRWAVSALRSLGVPAEHRPLNDIATPRGKLAGSAQARRRGTVLHHTALAYDMEPALVRRVLRIGRPRVSARGLRSAEKDVSPLRWFTDLSQAEVVERLGAAFALDHGAKRVSLRAEDVRAAVELAARKYGLREWTHRLP